MLHRKRLLVPIGIRRKTESTNLYQVCNTEIRRSTIQKLCLRHNHRSVPTDNEKFDFNPTGPCRVLEWAAMSENRVVASDCLNVPALPCPQMMHVTSTPHGVRNWDEYWTHRKWIFPETLKDETERDHGQALVSHVMSAPMTIFSMLDLLLEASMTVTTSIKVLANQSKVKVRWCCIGARAEASLPMQYWQEMIDMIHVSRLVALRQHTIDRQDGTNNRMREMIPKPLDITLDFIGPEMNVHPTIVLHPSKLLPHGDFVSDDATQSPFTTCTIRWKHKGVYHTHFNEMNERDDGPDKDYDAFILFNPGIAHPYLQELWKPTLQIIFEQYFRIRSTSVDSCAILLTAHSKIDALRDSALLQRYMSSLKEYNTDEYHIKATTSSIENESSANHVPGTLNYYFENPFASRIYYQDPIGQEQSNIPHIVRPNHYVTMLRSR